MHDLNKLRLGESPDEVSNVEHGRKFMMLCWKLQNNHQKK